MLVGELRVLNTPINNNNTKQTGCAGDTVSAGATTNCNNEYKSTKGVEASTTGNINGIYDMSGGAYEYVSAILTTAPKDNDNYENYYKEILSEIDSKNVTKLEEGYTLKNTIGMAIYETKNYYNDGYSEVNETNPTIIKGGSYGYTKSAGAFTNYISTGVSSSNVGFRITLRVTKKYNNDAYYEVDETYPTIRKGGYYGHTTSAGAFANYRNTGGSSSSIGFRITLSVEKITTTMIILKSLKHTQ